jgi:hypothetical protein
MWGGMRKNDGGGESIKIHCKYICEFHNETPTPIYLIYANKNVKKKK